MMPKIVTISHDLQCEEAQSEENLATDLHVN
jgi:hypothetical protein